MTLDELNQLKQDVKRTVSELREDIALVERAVQYIDQCNRGFEQCNVCQALADTIKRCIKEKT